MADIEQLKKMVPLITYEISILLECLRVDVFGVNVTNLDLGVQINPVKQPIKSNSVGARHMFHRRTSTFDNHLIYRLIALKDIQQSTRLECVVLGGM